MRAAEDSDVGTSPTRILIADDHRTFAELFALGLEREPDLEAVGHARTAAEALQMAESLRPDLVIMDVRLGDGDGIEVTAQLTERYEDLCVIVLTGHPDPSVVSRAAKAGACGFLPKDGALDAMLHALRSARRGSLVLPPEMVDLMAQGSVRARRHGDGRPQPDTKRAGGPGAARTRTQPAHHRPPHRPVGRRVPHPAAQCDDQARSHIAARGGGERQPLRSHLPRRGLMTVRPDCAVAPAPPAVTGRETGEDDHDLFGTDPPRSRSQVWSALARFAVFGLIALLVVLAGTIDHRRAGDPGRDPAACEAHSE